MTIGIDPVGSEPIGTGSSSVAAGPAPTAAITSVVADGSTVTIGGTTTNTPTSGLATIAAGSGGAVTQGPIAITLGTNTFTATFAAVAAGTYSGETVTVTNAGGTTTATGSSSFSVVAVSGTPTSPAADTTSPTMVGSLTSSAITTSGFALTWSSATDNTAVTGYEVSIDNGVTYIPIGNVLTSQQSGLAANTLYNTSVRAFDAAGNKAIPLSLATTTAAVTAAPDVIPPVMVGSIYVSAITTSGFTFSYLAATDAVGVVSYEYSIDGGSTYTNSGNVLTVTRTRLSASSLYNIRVRALDAAGNRAIPLSAVAITLVNTGASNVSTQKLVDVAGGLYIPAVIVADSTGGYVGYATTVGTQTSVASGVTDVTILAANSARRGLIIDNESTSMLYLLLSSAVSSTSVYTIRVPANGNFAMKAGEYSGIIKGVWATANGFARVTEFV